MNEKQKNEREKNKLLIECTAFHIFAFTNLLIYSIMSTYLPIESSFFDVYLSTSHSSNGMTSLLYIYCTSFTINHCFEEVSHRVGIIFEMPLIGSISFFFAIAIPSISIVFVSEFFFCFSFVPSHFFASPPSSLPFVFVISLFEIKEMI